MIDLAALDFAVVPVMVREAKARLQIADGKVTHAMLQRTSRPFSDTLGWRVYVSGARKSGSIEVDTAGRVTKVWN